MEFTHFDDQGNALMVDVGDKAETKREAVARGSIFMSPECLEKVARGTMAKGDVLGVAFTSKVCNGSYHCSKHLDWYSV